MGRKILLITTDQQRHDALGCTGGGVARTPAIDALASSGLNFRRARNQCTVCMPGRATILTGQYIGSHGVTSNGIPLPVDAPNLAAYLNQNGYRTALLGKAHFEPASHTDYFENWAATKG
ncbi:MAG: sulfatase-like hydrolase/transferase, partial [Alphaproteobacteria bacterium]|nr:sulfatase-like hydrolase/transferase [Alphaproteobacteria bacterium]